MRAPLLCVLVVDDDERVRHAICDLLRSQSDINVVCEASNGLDAILFAKKHNPHLVLLDLAMPVINGFDAARLLKHELPATQILVVSGSRSQAFMREAFAAGASGYVTKDKLSSELISEVRRIQSLMGTQSILAGRV